LAVLVRRAREDDAPNIAGFAMKLVDQHRDYDPVRFARIATLDGMQWFYGSQTEARDAAVLVAELDERIVGFAYISYEKKNYAELTISAAKLHDIYVDESARHSGAGKALIGASVEVARELGASKLILSVAEKNSAAKRFFERNGFHVTMHEMMLRID